MNLLKLASSFTFLTLVQMDCFSFGLAKRNSTLTGLLFTDFNVSLGGFSAIPIVSFSLDEAHLCFRVAVSFATQQPKGGWLFAPGQILSGLPMHY